VDHLGNTFFGKMGVTPDFFIPYFNTSCAGDGDFSPPEFRTKHATRPFYGGPARRGRRRSVNVIDNSSGEKGHGQEVLF
jgi:hypothetical protein